MNNSHRAAYKQKLLDKQLDLTAGIARLEQEIRQFENVEVEDYGDRAENTYTKESLFQQVDSDRALLTLVADALRRMAEGQFGKCVECGDEVEAKRLDAVPWARYCIHCEQRAHARMV
jgi:RNA polymerase-binding transcription factor